MSPRAEAPPGDGRSGGVSIDAAFISFVGEFGRSQRLYFALAQLAWLPAGMMTLVMVFTTLDPVSQSWFRCLPDSAQHAACEDALHTANVALAGQKFCELPAGVWEWTRRHDSIVSEWDLVCAESWKQQAVNSGFFGGFLFGAAIFGTLSDKLGRKSALALALLVSGAGSLACAASPSYWLFFAARTVTGVGVAGIGLVGYVLGCEFVGPTWRGILGISAQYFFVVGTVLLPLVAFYAPNWRLLCAITGGIGLLYCLMIPLIPESPRWLLATGKSEDAARVMRRIADGNGAEWPPNVSLAEAHADSDDSAPKAGLRDLLGHRILFVRMAVQTFCWFAISSTYYGINLMVADLPGSVYVNNAMLALVEVVAYVASSALVDLRCVGRRGALTGSYLIGGVCLIISALSSGLPRLLFALAAKVGAAAAFALVFLYAAELFPTVVRNACLGMCSLAARVGGITTPLVIYTGTALHSSFFAFGYMGFICVLAGLMLLTQPETLGRLMPDCLEDVILFHPPSMDDNSSAPASSDEEAAGSDGGPPPEALPGFQFGGQKLRADGYTPLPVQT